MQKPKSIKELLNTGGKRLSAIKAQAQQRTHVQDHVCAALPAKLAAVVVSAGIDQGRLTVGVASAAWAARLRYLTATLRQRVSTTLKVDIQQVRIRVVPRSTLSPNGPA